MSVRRALGLAAATAVVAAASIHIAIGAFLTGSGDDLVISRHLTTPSAGDSSATSTGVAVLSSNVLPGLAAVARTGGPSPDAQLHVAIGLRDRDRAGMDSLLGAIDDPHSPLYRRFLAPQEFADRFGPDPSSWTRLLAWLRSGGFTVTQTATSRDFAQAVGTVAAAERLFGTTIRTYRWEGHDFYANDSPPRVPAGLGIISVIGLNDLQGFHTFADAPHPAAAPIVHGLPGSFKTGVLTAQDLWSIYDQPDENKGQGQTMAIFAAGAGARTVSNLRSFEAMQGLPQVPVTVVEVGAGPHTDTSNDLEWSLDTQASTGMAPLASREDLYVGSSLSDTDVAAVFSKWADDDVDKQASASYGECETSPVESAAYSTTKGQLGNNLEPVAEQILTRANLQGQTLFASTGDTGAFCPTVGLALNGVTYTGDPRLNYPAASPHVVAVGGTVLYGDGSSPPKRGFEYGWTHTGGGSSVFVAAPDFQQKAGVLVGRCVVDPNGGTSAAGQLCRGIPDVAAISGDIGTSAYRIFYGGGQSAAGGTSLSSPLWLGMWTRIQAAAADQAHGLGFADPVLYRVAADATKYTRDFYDVTVGDNGLFAATTGWDYVSGWGTPDIRNLLLDIDGKTAPTNNNAPPPPAAGSSPVTAPSTSVTCGPLWVSSEHSVTGPAGDSEPQLELLQGDVSLSADQATLHVVLTVADAETTVPPGAAGVVWATTWTSGGTDYFASAFLSASGKVSYSDGTVSGSTYLQGHSDTGSIASGKRGRIQVDVSVGNVGAAAGSVLAQPTGHSFRFVGDPVLGNGVQQPADTGGPQHDYTVGATCTGAATAAAASGQPQQGGAQPPPATPPQPQNRSSNPIGGGGVRAAATAAQPPAAGTGAASGPAPVQGVPAPPAQEPAGPPQRSATPGAVAAPPVSSSHLWQSPWLVLAAAMLATLIIAERLRRRALQWRSTTAPSRR